MLPVSHAIGGNADIIYDYEASLDYPEHSLLLEATLADGTNQRRMEMEPVSRHLGNYLIATKNYKSFCIFVTNNLHINVLSDFRNRKTIIYYNTQDYDDFVSGMKIIPINTSDLRSIIKNRIKHIDIYKKFEKAYQCNENNPKRWYDEYVSFS